MTIPRLVILLNISYHLKETGDIDHVSSHFPFLPPEAFNPHAAKMALNSALVLSHPLWTDLLDKVIKRG
jgi:hypothetical protein